MLVYFSNRTFLYVIMLALILLNLYFAVILFFFYYFSFYEPTLFSKRFAFDCGLRRWIDTKVLVVYLYPIDDKYFLPFWEDNSLIFFIFPWFFRIFSYIILQFLIVCIAHYFNCRVLLGSMLSLIIIHKKSVIKCSKLNLSFWASLANMRKFCTVLLNASITPCDWGCPGVPFTK